MDTTNNAGASSEQPIGFAGSELGARRHICAFFNSADEEYRVLLPFIKEGIERGEKAFHVVDPELREAHLRQPESAGIDVATVKAAGQFELFDWNEMYFPDGRFDEARMLAKSAVFFRRTLSTCRPTNSCTNCVNAAARTLEQPYPPTDDEVGDGKYCR